MSSDETKIPETLADGMRVRSEEVGFAAEELAACRKCKRPNAPGRETCIYCGEVFLSDPVPRSITAAHEEAHEELLEAWENGFNVVALPGERTFSSAETEAIWHIAKIGEGAFGMTIEGISSAIPVGRFASDAKAGKIAENLVSGGVNATVIGDKELDSDRSPVRIRAMEFIGDECVFVDFNTGKRTTVEIDAIRLIVFGSLFEARVETTEKKRRRKASEVEEMQTESERPVLDIYSKGDAVGYRVNVHGFDFSCLGGEKSMLAGENIKRLALKLQDSSKKCRLDREYANLRPLLDEMWELETVKDHLGMLRVGLERKGRTTVTTRNNLRQFTKYSRLQQLYEEAADRKAI